MDERWATGIRRDAEGATGDQETRAWEGGEVRDLAQMRPGPISGTGKRTARKWHVAGRAEDVRAQADLSLRRAFGAPLTDLVDPRNRVIPPRVRDWRIPIGAYREMVRYGLPRVVKEGFCENSPEEGGAPVLSSAHGRLYRLGSLNDVEIGVQEGVGVVRGVPSGGDAPEFVINSTLERYIESAWRWVVALPVLVGLVDWAWSDEQLDFFHTKCEEAAAAFTRIDPVASRAEDSFWRTLTDV
ncbi:SUKH-4 family immunity protein [Nocardiopsis sp. RSe5-2]|uniref:SUKH-4 family immunity protein n=1 Tax=Nocardiopsis endophytica TaxID=3018445 RepID=A0ABT4U284_9ACTN|nr:SUKH-4 family immunity protein [Nocardiopsis endophytica]MDA2811059.1 SUKH-4 family immunity protein [Nocardiopsis endophytica]